MTTLDLAALYSALGSAHSRMAFDSRDWARTDTDAWLYGIFVGWSEQPDDDPSGGDVDQGSALEEVAARHRWDAATVERLQMLRAAVRAFRPERSRGPGIPGGAVMTALHRLERTWRSGLHWVVLFTGFGLALLGLVWHPLTGIGWGIAIAAAVVNLGYGVAIVRLLVQRRSQRRAGR